jgi:hypothetical protein
MPSTSSLALEIRYELQVGSLRMEGTYDANDTAPAYISALTAADRCMTTCIGVRQAAQVKSGLFALTLGAGFIDIAAFEPAIGNTADLA